MTEFDYRIEKIGKGATPWALHTPERVYWFRTRKSAVCARLVYKVQKSSKVHHPAVNLLQPGTIKKVRTITTAICVDPMGWSLESSDEEVTHLTREFRKLLAPAQLDVYSAPSCYSGHIKEGTELILFDFGGMMPGTDLPDRNAREVVRWAENHPAGLVVVVSEMTYERFVVDQMRELGLTGLTNVILNCMGEPLPEWFTGKPTSDTTGKR